MRGHTRLPARHFTYGRKSSAELKRASKAGSNPFPPQLNKGRMPKTSWKTIKRFWNLLLLPKRWLTKKYPFFSPCTQPLVKKKNFGGKNLKAYGSKWEIEIQLISKSMPKPGNNSKQSKRSRIKDTWSKGLAKLKKRQPYILAPSILRIVQLIPERFLTGSSSHLIATNR